MTKEDNRSSETRETDAPTDHSTTTFSRRSYLRGLGAAGLAGGLVQRGGLVGAAAAADPSQYADRFETVVDVVDAGADNSGQEPVSSVLQEHLDDDTLLAFPPGRYYMDEQVRFTDFDNVGLVGDDATLVPANFHDFDGPQYRLFRLGTHYSPGTDLLVVGFTVDQTAPDTGIRVVDAVVDDGLHVEDVYVDGRHDSGTFGPGRFNVLDAGGDGLVRRFRAPDGGQWESETPNAGNIWRGPTGILANMTAGTLRFEDCELGGFPDNGLYASGGSGRIIVDGGHYRNSNAPNIRVGGAKAVVRGVTVTVDETPAVGFDDQRGIRLQNAADAEILQTTVDVRVDQGVTAIHVPGSAGTVWIEDVDVTVDSSVGNTAISVSPDAGKTTVYSSTIDMSAPGGYGIVFEGPDASASAHVESVDIVGDVGDEGARAAIRNTRDDVDFRAVSIDQPGGQKRYGLVNLGDDCLVYKSNVRTANYPLLEAGTGTHVEDNYANSYGDREAIALHDDSEDVYLKNNRLRGGIRDAGSAGLKLVGNEF
ncbi:hypothetical protein SAMN05216559_0540 [Halomicrobium zhouii]|uniref:Right handed beta helix region n=1 Tax=Halomicrobium zhouii TaxID=767519 RepID=A0A1I6KC83_9EURY|nr:hypothetical protein [Halomicrobium zhouii]SFR88829.1 hypothetical protein SAMN05216559_0540 [Halomicrobium zhouii]